MAQANDEELTRLQQKVIDEFRELGRVTPETARALHDAQTEISNFNFKVEAGTKFLSKLGDAVSNTAKAMYRGEKGASAFNQSIGDMADAAQLAAVGLSLLIPGGPIMKAVVAGLTYLGTSALKAGSELVQTANKQSDSLYSAFQKMSKSGASASDGLTGVFGDIQKLGLGIQDLDGYVNMINESSRDLAMFRGNVADGRKAFADMNQQMKPFTQQLYNAGLSQEDITHGAMGYLKIQTQIGRAQTMTTAELAQGAKKYLIEQDALTKLTGQTRQEAEAARAKAMSEQRFRAVVERGLRSDDADQREGAQKLILANQFLSNQSEAAGQGFRDLTTNMITSDAGLKAYNSSNGAALRISQLLRNNQISVIDGMQDLTAAFGENGDALMSMAETGVYEDYGIPFADTMKLGTLSGNNLVEALKKVEEEQKKQGVTGKTAQDALQQIQTETRELQRDTMLMTQAFVQDGVLPATEATKKLAEAANAAATALLAETRSRKILEPGTVTTTEQQKDISRTSAGTGGTMVEGAIVGGFGGEGDAGAIMAAAIEPPSASAAPAAPSVAPAATVRGRGGMNTPPGSVGAAMPGYEKLQPAQVAQLSQIREMIAGVESKGNYNIVVGGKEYPLTDMTIQEVMNLQRQLMGQGKNSAAGKYQVKYSTLVDAVGKIGLKYDQKFNQATQDTIADFLILRRGYTQYQKSSTAEAKERFLTSLSQEWAGLPSSPKGDSYYKGVGDNKAHIGWQEALAKFGDGGIAQGPKSGYPAMLHGQEAVIPLKNGSVPVTINPTGLMNLMPSLEIDSDTADQISESFKAGMNTDFSAMVGSLNELVRQQQDQNSSGLQERMIALLEDIRSSQISTADHTGRMAAVASN